MTPMFSSNFKIYLLIIITRILSAGCATRCYDSPFPDFTYYDSYNNKITIISRGMFAKEIDTTFLKMNLSGLHLNNYIKSDTLRFDYTISKTEKINPNVYLIYVQTKPHTDNPKIISQYQECKNYRMKTSKFEGKLRIDEVKQICNCMWIENLKTKRLVSQ